MKPIPNARIRKALHRPSPQVLSDVLFFNTIQQYFKCCYIVASCDESLHTITNGTWIVTFASSLYVFHTNRISVHGITTHNTHTPPLSKLLHTHPHHHAQNHTMESWWGGQKLRTFQRHLLMWRSSQFACFILDGNHAGSARIILLFLDHAPSRFSDPCWFKPHVKKVIPFRVSLEWLEKSG
jgi:hypothetical protein